MIQTWVNVLGVGCDAAKVGIKTESVSGSSKNQYLALRAFGTTLADISQTKNVEKITAKGKAFYNVLLRWSNTVHQ